MSSQDYGWGQVEPLYENGLSVTEKKLREKFVKEYMHDREPYAAALRCGFMSAFALEYSKRFMTEPYVRQLIKKYEESDGVDPRIERARNEKLVESILLKVAQDPQSPQSAKVTACTRLSSIYGMDAAQKVKHDINHRGGVMMIPAIADMDDWEKTARESQDNLMRHARDN